MIERRRGMEIGATKSTMSSWRSFERLRAYLSKRSGFGTRSSTSSLACVG